MTVHFRAAKLLHYYFKYEIKKQKNLNNIDIQSFTLQTFNFSTKNYSKL
jgi:hypothetical protein